MFFEVLSAINNPNQQASIGQLQQITQSAQTIASSHGINPNQMQLMMTILGNALQPILKQKQVQLGARQLASIVSRASDASVLASIIPLQQQQQLTQTVAQKIGMPAAVAQTLLPQMLPIVMTLFSMGTSTPGSVGATNSLLSAFLDDNRPDNTDLGKVITFAGRFLNAPR